MQTEQLVLPTLATVALGTALLVPLRDERRGRRATHGASGPLRPDFRAITAAPDTDVQQPQDQDESSATGCTLQVTDAETVAAPAEATDEGVMAAEVPRGARLQSYASRARRFCADSYRSFLEILRSWLVLSYGAPSPDHAVHTETYDEAKDGEANDDEAKDGDAKEATIVERSFAAEVAALFGVVEAAPTAMPHDRAEDSDGTETSAEMTAPDTESSDPTQREPSSPGDAPGEAIRSTVVLEATAAPCERVVPLTRLPLRPYAQDITWAESFGASTIAERHALLEAMATRVEPHDFDLLVAAYREEQGADRTLALRALAARFPREAHATFLDALHVGSDEERALAIDALTAAGARESLVPAFDDRVEAIAARAALAYVASTQRTDYVRELGERVDAPRLAAILGLLAGVVE